MELLLFFITSIGMVVIVFFSLKNDNIQDESKHVGPFRMSNPEPKKTLREKELARRAARR